MNARTSVIRKLAKNIHNGLSDREKVEFSYKDIYKEVKKQSKILRVRETVSHLAHN